MKKTIMIAIALLATSSFAFASPQYKLNDVLQFKITNSCPQCDLSGADLDINHSNALLTGSNLSNLHGNSINLANSNAQNANFSGANLNGANFSDANLSGTNFAGAQLANANFSGAHDANLSHAHLCNTIMPNGITSKC